MMTIATPHMKDSPSCEPSSSLVSQEIPHISVGPMANKKLPLVPTLIQMNPV